MNLIDNQQVVLSVTGVDDQGQPTEDLGTLSASSSDESVVTVTDNGDNTFTAVTTGALGSATVTIATDVDGDALPDFNGSIAFDVFPGTVAALNVTAGEPTTRP